jgi:hypothetical protein
MPYSRTEGALLTATKVTEAGPDGAVILHNHPESVWWV